MGMEGVMSRRLVIFSILALAMVVAPSVTSLQAGSPV